MGEQALCPIEQRAARFARDILDYLWDGVDPDGGDIQDLAEKHGLIKNVGFNPDVHHDHLGVGLEAGDDWFVAVPELSRLASATPSQPTAKRGK